MPQYVHCYSLFCVDIISDDPEAQDVTPQMIRECVIERVRTITDPELKEDCELLSSQEIQTVASRR